MNREPNRPRLGRGLSSLIRSSKVDDGANGQYEPATAPPGRESSVPANGDVIRHINVSDIGTNPLQPRREFDQAALNELADSIRTNGLLQPILVCETPGDNGALRYQLIAGERRLRASRLAGLATVPAILKPATLQQMLALALIENIQRSDLGPMERASAYRELMDRFGMTQEQVAQSMGEPRATIANYLRLLDLCTEVQELIGPGGLSFGHAKVLAGLAGMVEGQLKLARKALAENMPVRRLEELVKLVQDGTVVLSDGPVIGRRLPPQKSAYLSDVERQLAQALGGRVQIRPGRGKHRGRIVIEYRSLEDFDRIVRTLGVKLES